MTSSSKPSLQPSLQPGAAVAPSTLAKLALLASLYFSQGLPYGFFTQALPVWMREAGMDRGAIGLTTTLLVTPWALKLLWAPLVDRFGGSSLGRRRGWIVPLQVLTVVVLATLAFVFASGQTPGALPMISALAAGLVITSLLSATQDIATDGLAVDTLSSSERGVGNGVQVAAYRVGMIVGGGGLLMLLGALGVGGAFGAMAALVALMTLPIILHRERPVSSTRSTDDGERVSWAAVLQFLGRKRGHMIVWCLGIGLYKIGDAFGSPMARIMLVDLGYSVDRIGWLLGVLGSVAGMTGALLGGLLARRGRLLALVVCGVVHAALMAAYGLAVLQNLDVGVIGALVVLEHLTGGMATVALFTAMMDATQKETGATDYTVQACVVLWASGLGSAGSGFSADQLGYVVHFGAAGVACLVGTLAMIPLYRLKIAPRDPSFDDELARVSLSHGAVSSTGSAAVSATTSEPR